MQARLRVVLPRERIALIIHAPVLGQEIGEREARHLPLVEAKIGDLRSVGRPAKAVDDPELFRIHPIELPVEDRVTGTAVRDLDHAGLRAEMRHVKVRFLREGDRVAVRRPLRIGGRCSDFFQRVVGKGVNIERASGLDCKTAVVRGPAGVIRRGAVLAESVGLEQERCGSPGEGAKHERQVLGGILRGEHIGEPPPTVRPRDRRRLPPPRRLFPKRLRRR